MACGDGDRGIQRSRHVSIDRAHAKDDARETAMLTKLLGFFSPTHTSLLSENYFYLFSPIRSLLHPAHLSHQTIPPRHSSRSSISTLQRCTTPLEHHSMSAPMFPALASYSEGTSRTQGKQTMSRKASPFRPCNGISAKRPCCHQLSHVNG